MDWLVRTASRRKQLKDIGEKVRAGGWTKERGLLDKPASGMAMGVSQPCRQQVTRVFVIETVPSWSAVQSGGWKLSKLVLCTGESTHRNFMEDSYIFVNMLDIFVTLPLQREEAPERRWGKLRGGEFPAYFMRRAQRHTKSTYKCENEGLITLQRQEKESTWKVIVVSAGASSFYRKFTLHRRKSSLIEKTLMRRMVQKVTGLLMIQCEHCYFHKKKKKRMWRVLGFHPPGENNPCEGTLAVCSHVLVSGFNSSSVGFDCFSSSKYTECSRYL